MEVPRRVIRGILVAILSLVIAKVVRFLRWRQRVLERFHGPPPSLFLGNLPLLWKKGGFSKRFFEDLHKRYGPVVRFFTSSSSLNLSILDSEMQVQVLQLCPSRPLETKQFLGFLGDDNLLFLHGEEANQLRKRYMRMLSSKELLRRVHDQVKLATREHCLEWSKKTSLDMFEVLGPFLYDVIGSVFFQPSWCGSKRSRRMFELHQYILEWSEVWGMYIVPPYWREEFRTYCDAVREWRDLCGNMIDERRAQIAQRPESFVKDDSVLTMLVSELDDEGNPFFNKHQAVSTLIGFLNGAFEPCLSSAYWALYDIAKNQGSQFKLVQELQSKIGDRDVHFDKISECEFLDAVLMESMRINCTVPVNQRVNFSEDVRLSNDLVVPRGTVINLPVFQSFRDPTWFGPHPESFDPTRFLPTSPTNSRARKCFSVYGFGPRACLGVDFATVILKSLLTYLLQHHTLSLHRPSETVQTAIFSGVLQPTKRNTFALRTRPTQQHEQ